VLLSVTLIALYLFSNKSSADTDKRNELNNQIQALKAKIKNDPMLAAQSSPFAYTDNDEFRKIQKLGIDYIPEMESYIEKDAGLIGYLLTTVVVKNSKVKLKDYSNTKEWMDNWKEYKLSVPQKYLKLKADLQLANDEKSKKAVIDAITDLGVPIIPYLIDDIEATQNADSVSILSNLLSDEGLNLPLQDAKNDWKAWAKQNKNKYSFLKSL
jgi:hypothetical protein